MAELDVRGAESSGGWRDLSGWLSAFLARSWGKFPKASFCVVLSAIEGFISITLTLRDLFSMSYILNEF